MVIVNEAVFNNERVSIITPMYNAIKTVSQTIESVQAQTYTNWEMIIVDDCSTDGCSEIVKKYSENDPRIIYCRHNCNCGIAKSRNDALQMASGRFIAFLDSDDLWKPHKLEIQIKSMKENNIAFSFTACEVMNEGGNSLNKIRHIPFEIDYKGLLNGNCIPCLTVVLDRNIIKVPQVRQIPHEDYQLWLEILKTGVTAFGIDEALSIYRESSGSRSGNKLKAAKWTWDILYSHQQLGVIKSCIHFVRYVYNAIMKRK